MFKLVELSIGWFAIVKATDEISGMPINAHGFIQVSFFDEKYFTIMPKGVSKELLESNEVEALQEEAIELTIDAVADEFGD